MPVALGLATEALLAELSPAGHWVGELSSSALATATAVVALAQIGREADGSLIRGGLGWLARTQNADGGWSGVRGGPSSVEETALAVAALGGTAEVAAVESGGRWLTARVLSGAWREPSPIGFYFAKLWYSERLYPLIFATGALGKVAALR